MKINHTAIAIGLIIFGCAGQQNDPKAELLQILKFQEDAYADQSEENKRKLIETCTDSLVFIGGEDGGMLITPQAWVGDLGDGWLRRPFERTFHIYDNTAIVTSKHQAFKLLGADTLILNARTTRTFVKENNQWKMACISYAPLAIHYDQLAKPDLSVYQKYVGIYDIGTSGRDSVYIENGKLYTNGSELLPLNDSTFIGSDYFGKTIFGKSSYTFEWSDGQRITFAKIK